MGARVLFRDSQGRDGQVDLTPSAPLYVGRALDCAIRTDDAMVSRKHSMIRMENGRFFVEDLGSSNGTHVNDVRVTKHLLNHNDVVRCGSLWLRYVEDGPVAASGAALPQSPVAQPSPGRKGGTQRLDPADLGVHGGGAGGAGGGAGGAGPAGGAAGRAGAGAGA
ncbi:MAG TPA: FHA domain-containing protein, partial [Kofleriaceae bacterium]|nr:FHA domain-containing protein [Kofleriaceae bacterium]